MRTKSRTRCRQRRRERVEQRRGTEVTSLGMGRERGEAKMNQPADRDASIRVSERRCSPLCLSLQKFRYSYLSISLLSLLSGRFSVAVLCVGNPTDLGDLMSSLEYTPLFGFCVVRTPGTCPRYLRTRCTARPSPVLQAPHSAKSSSS